MTIVSKIAVDKQFYTVSDNALEYSVIKQIVESGAPSWYAVTLSGTIEDITNTELGQSLIAYCQANP
jgi:hypothetical protein